MSADPVTDRSPGCAAIDAPLVVDGAAAVTWAAETDLLVLGLGAAGGATALEAAARGLDVTVADRFSGGGASWLSGGIVYAGGGTRYQRRAGHADTPEAMADYLVREVGDAVSAETVRRYCADSAGMIDWLEAQGVVFDAAEAPHETSYPAQEYYLYYSGNEKVPANLGAHPPAPRGHRPKGKWLSGRAMMEALLARVRATPRITVRTESAVRRLVVDKAGAVIGAELMCLPEGRAVTRLHRRLERLARVMFLQAVGISVHLARLLSWIEARHARPRLIAARRGVVIATGGFIKNRAMVEHHAPAFMAGFALGSTGCDGSGIRLGLTVGGRLDRAGTISAWRFINPPHAFAHGIVVDTAGRRLTNEEQYGARLGDALVRRAGGRAYLIIDQTLRDAALAEIRGGGMWGFQKFPARVLLARPAAKAGTIEALAGKLGMAAPVLAEAVAANNAAAQGKAPDPVGKSDEMRSAIAAAPFYAVDISAGLAAFPLPVLTLGGLNVDEATGAVLREGEGAIPGLYAVGRAARGLPSNFYISGLSLGDCIWSGRRTAAAVAGVDAVAAA